MNIFKKCTGKYIDEMTSQEVRDLYNQIRILPMDAVLFMHQDIHTFMMQAHDIIKRKEKEERNGKRNNKV